MVVTVVSVMVVIDCLNQRREKKKWNWSLVFANGNSEIVEFVKD